MLIFRIGMQTKTLSVYSLIVGLIVITQFGFCQTAQNRLQAYIDKFDPATSKTGFLFNRGFLSPARFAKSTLKHNPGGDFVITNALQWKLVYLSLQQSEISPNVFTNYTKVFPEGEKHGVNAEIPIGIINIDGEYIAPDDIAQHIDQGTGKLRSSTPYRHVKIFTISNLQEHVYNENVKFVLDPKWYFTNSKDPIVSMEIDFDDGNGYRSYPFGHQEIAITYSILGEKSIRYKLHTESGTMLSFSKINVHTVRTLTPGLKGRIMTSATAGSRTMITGGQYEVYYGCDNVLDRPVVIVEGFDPLKSRTFQSLFNTYFNPGFGENLMSLGYDLVILKFNNNHSAIENNAQVLKSLLAEVNGLKTGNTENIVIGESMGGLITRVALAQLEAEGVDHEVGLYISFDSPHKGANIPIGLQELVYDGLEIDFVEVFEIAAGVSISMMHGLEFAVDTIELLEEMVEANNSPAVRQMLIRHRDYKDVVNPDFLDFQDFLNTTGYPVHSRNIAVINGSHAGLQQTTAGGDEVLNMGENYIQKQIGCDCCGLKVYAAAAVSPINMRAQVSDLEVYTSPAPCVAVRTTDREGTATFDHKPYDISPGGTTDSFGEDQDVFSFVPTVSSIDLDNDMVEGENGLFYFNQGSANLDRRKNRIITLGQTPFDDIYSNFFNSEHVSVNNAPFGAVMQREIMPVDMFLQNKTIIAPWQRDYIAQDEIVVGNNVNPWINAFSPWTNKMIDNGDFVIQSGAEVKFTATNRITLRPGFRANQGSKFSTRLTSVPDCFTEGRIVSGTHSAIDEVLPLPEIDIKQVNAQALFDIQNYQDYQETIHYRWTLTGEGTHRISNAKIFSASDLQDGQYTITATINNQRSVSRIFSVGYPSLAVTQSHDAMPESSDIIKIYPNPSSRDLSISFNVKTAASLHVYITDTYGRKVKDLVQRLEVKGDYEDMFDISSLPAGLYLMVVQAGDMKTIKKIIVLD